MRRSRPRIDPLPRRPPPRRCGDYRWGAAARSGAAGCCRGRGDGCPEDRLQVAPQAAGQGRSGVAGADADAQMALADQGGHRQGGVARQIEGVDGDPPPPRLREHPPAQGVVGAHRVQYQVRAAQIPAPVAARAVPDAAGGGPLPQLPVQLGRHHQHLGARLQQPPGLVPGLRAAADYQTAAAGNVQADLKVGVELRVVTRTNGSQRPL